MESLSVRTGIESLLGTGIPEKGSGIGCGWCEHDQFEGIITGNVDTICRPVPALQPPALSMQHWPEKLKQIIKYLDIT